MESYLKSILENYNYEIVHNSQVNKIQTLTLMFDENVTQEIKTILFKCDIFKDIHYIKPIRNKIKIKGLVSEKYYNNLSDLRDSNNYGKMLKFINDFNIKSIDDFIDVSDLIIDGYSKRAHNETDIYHKRNLRNLKNNYLSFLVKHKRCELSHHKSETGDDLILVKSKHKSFHTRLVKASYIPTKLLNSIPTESELYTTKTYEHVEFDKDTLKHMWIYKKLNDSKVLKMLGFVDVDGNNLKKWESWLGKAIKKESGKPFKDGEHEAIPLEIIDNPYTGRKAFNFGNDYNVECRMCNLV